MEDELNAGLEKVKLNKGSKTKTEPMSPEAGPSIASPIGSNDSRESLDDSSPRLVDTPPHRLESNCQSFKKLTTFSFVFSNPVSPTSSGSAANFGINGYLVGPPMQVKINKKHHQGGRN